MQLLCSVSCRGKSCAGTLCKAYRLLFSSYGERLVSELEVWSQISPDPNCFWGKCNIWPCWKHHLDCWPHSWCFAAHIHCPPHSSAKIQLKRKYFLEAFEVKTLLNFGCSSAFLSSSVHLILLYRINLCVCLYMEQSWKRNSHSCFLLWTVFKMKNHSSLSFQWNNIEIKIVRDQVVIKISCWFFLFWL